MAEYILLFDRFIGTRFYLMSLVNVAIILYTDTFYGSSKKSTSSLGVCKDPFRSANTGELTSITEYAVLYTRRCRAKIVV